MVLKGIALPKFAANLSMLFPELPLSERFAAAENVGFEAVEYLFPYANSIEQLRGWVRAAGEVNLPYLFDVCDRLGYDGWIGCEYRPKTTTLEGLGWAAPYGIGTSA